LKSADEVLASFAANAEAVKRLARIDELVIQFAVEQIRARDTALLAALQNMEKRLPERLSGERTVANLQRIRDNQSLRAEYEVMFNQAVVLLVSHFASALHDLFRFFFQLRVADGRSEAASKEEVRVTFQRLAEMNWDVRGNAADLFLSARDISFQDMQSTVRSFRKWLGYAPARDHVTNDVILGQAARHAIVHSEGVADDRFIGQVRNAAPRTLKPAVQLGEPLVFSAEEICALATSMTSYLTDLRSGVSAAGSDEIAEPDDANNYAPSESDRPV
jgi:hypothetical protein